MSKVQQKAIVEKNRTGVLYNGYKYGHKWYIIPNLCNVTVLHAFACVLVSVCSNEAVFHSVNLSLLQPEAVINTLKRRSLFTKTCPWQHVAQNKLVLP